jgi:hypothetical protein
MCAYLVSENYRKLYKLAKFIEYYLFVRKLGMTYQNVQKNEIYLLVSQSCIVKQLEPCPN